MRLARTLLRDSSGVTAIEFGLIAPTFMMVLMGLADLSHTSYANSVLAGAVQQAARSSSLETGDTAVADAKVENIVDGVLPDVTIQDSRVSYFDFADVGRPEQWDDADNDGSCNGGEHYTDENRNGQWDPDVGVNGNGSASDVVIYKVTATYNSPFAIPLLPESMTRRTLTATAVKKNQPFATQRTYGSSAGVCTD